MQKRWNFSASREGWTYDDDTFRLTSEPGYASGSWVSAGGHGGGGALAVRLGGIDDDDVRGMSGGWSKAFSLAGTEDVTLSFRVKVTQTNAYDPREYSEAVVSIDGTLHRTGVRVTGDGDGGPSRSSGWKLVTIELGDLGPGRHTLTLGGYGNAKTDADERSSILFDSVRLSGKAADAEGIDLRAFEAEVLALTNAYRAEHGREPFRNDTRLNAAAEDWSRSMAKGDFFKHSTSAQVEKFGYDPASWGENIAAGYATPEAVVDGWIASPGHRANLLSDEFEEMGVGYVSLASDTGKANYHHYWTQTFGTEDTLV